MILGAYSQEAQMYSLFALEVKIEGVGTPNPTWVGVEYEKSQWSPSELGI